MPSLPTSAVLADALDFSLGVIERNMATLQDFPESCTGEAWKPIERNRDAGHWVDGFWVGLLWLAHGHTGDGRFERAAREWAERLAWLRESVATHDLGFIFGLSHVLGAQLTGDGSLCANALQAAGTLIRRYNPRGEYLQAWGTPDGTAKDRGRTNIDLMMNLALLYWASERSGDRRYADIATRHARTSRLAMVRGDGSTAHVADFDPATGLLVRQETHQGFSYDSCWSRGHAWALYGFATCHRFTGNESFLAAARSLAGYALANLPEDGVPFWDYRSPDVPNTYRDSSATAVYASGLLELAEADPERAQEWRAAAERLFAALWRGYGTRETGMPALLKHGTRSVPHGYADHALIYGDYYFFEALTKLARPDLAKKALIAPRESQEGGGPCKEA
jgi:unsaturated chondroitin disaccharide hydrolase